MTVLLTNDHLAPLISAADFVMAQDAAYRSLAEGQGVCTPRIDLQSAEIAVDANYQLGLAAGMTGSYAALRIKSDVVTRQMQGGLLRKDKYCVTPGSYMGLVLLFARNNGALLAILHDGLLQKMRVGADSALGVRYMARPDAAVLGLLGSGGMARSHVAAIATVRPLRRVQVFSPSPANREAFANEIAEVHGLEAVVCNSPEAIYSGADLVSSCASAIGPMIQGMHLRPGMHVTCIGGTLDEVACKRVDRALRFGLAPAPAELPRLDFTGECLTFSESGSKATHGGTSSYAEIPDDRRLSFADYLANPSQRRISPDQITFSERGNIHGLQFAAVAGQLYERAKEAGVGHFLPPELFLQSVRN